MEVILSAGAFESPALLVASGVGLEDDLKEANIPSCGLDLPVGCNLRDHVLLPRLFIHPFTAYELSPSTVQAFYNIVDDERRFQVMLTGAATYPSLFAHVVASVIRRKVDLSPNWLTTLINILLDTAFRTIRVIVRNAVIYSPAFYFLRHFCFVANVALLNPKSCGRIRVRRGNHSSRPCRRKDLRLCIHGIYLTDDSDIEAYRSAWTRIGRLCSGWFHRGIELGTGSSSLIHRRDLFNTYAQEFSQPYYHWCGTCAIGTVVDCSLRIYGVKGLRVCDASVFPGIPSGPTTLTCAAVGYVLSGMLCKKHDGKTSTAHTTSQNL